MRDYAAEGWVQILSDNDLGSFGAIWDSCDEWVEEPNVHQRRGGWNGVARKVLRTPDVEEMGVYVKVHSNLSRRTFAHPIRGEPALARELRSNLRCIGLGVRCATPLYCAARWVGGEWRALFICREWAGYEALDKLAQRWSTKGFPGPRVRTRLAAAIAAEFRKIHDAGLVGIHLVPKHIFVKQSDGPGGIDPEKVGLIDMERMRGAKSLPAARLRDFRRLNEYAEPWSRTDRMRFLRAYGRTKKLIPEMRALWREILGREAGAPVR